MHNTVDENSSKPETLRNLASSALILSILGLVCVLIIWQTLGRSVAEKVATDLVQPLGFLSLCVAGFVLHSVRTQQFRWAGYLGVFLGVMVVAGNGIVASYSVGALEGPYLELDPLEGEPFDLLVLLGGGTSEAPNGKPMVNSSGDRVVMAARMFHLGKAKQILCTGSRIRGLSTSTSDGAERAKQLLVELGVTPNQITLVGGTNTSEELAKIKEYATEHSLEAIGVVSSAWHLNRVLSLAKQQQLPVQPVPADFKSSNNAGPIPIGAVVRSCVPNKDALFVNSLVLKELLAELLGR